MPSAAAAAAAARQGLRDDSFKEAMIESASADDAGLPPIEMPTMKEKEPRKTTNQKLTEMAAAAQRYLEQAPSIFESEPVLDRARRDCQLYGAGLSDPLVREVARRRKRGAERARPGGRCAFREKDRASAMAKLRACAGHRTLVFRN